MKTKSAKIPHKLGANQKEAAVKTVKHDANFKQSRDVREDRSQRQAKTTKPNAATGRPPATNIHQAHE
jgi:hypothetical protein